MKMRTLLLFELKKIFKSPLTFLFMIVAPFLLIATISFGIQPLLSTNSVIEHFDVAIVNIDNTPTSRSIIEQFESSEDFSEVVSFIVVDEQEAINLIHDNNVASVVVIPEGFSSSLRKGANKPLQVIGNYQRPLQSALFKEMMTGALNLITAAQSGVNTAYHFLHNEVTKKESKAIVKDAIVYFTFHSLSRNEVFQAEKFEAIPYFTTYQYYSSAGIIILLYVVSIFSIIVISTKENATINERLITFGVGYFPWVFAKFFTFLTVLFMQIILITLPLLFFIESFVVEELLLFILIMVLLLITVSAINTLFISFRFNAYITAMFALLAFIAMSYAGGSIIPLTLLPDTVRAFSTMTINQWAHSGLLNTLFISDLAEVKTSVIVLTSFSIILIFMSLVITKLRMRQL